MGPRYLITVVLCCAAFLAAGALWSAVPQRHLTVQVRETVLRADPSFLGKIIAKAGYGESVLLIEDRGSWQRVALGRAQGWMHASALTAKRLALKAGTADVQTSATGGEIALAGKGFNEAVERQYRNRHRELDYRWLDRMAGFTVTPEEMRAFLLQGRVHPAAGGTP